jgi:hypothetical protein
MLLLLAHIVLNVFLCCELPEKILLHACRLIEGHWLDISILVEVWACAISLEVVLLYFGGCPKIFPSVWSALWRVGGHIILESVVQILIIGIVAIFSTLTE